MILNNNQISFSIFDDQIRDEETLNNLAELRREYWLEINYPYDTYPIDHYKKQIKNQKNSSIRFENILMKDKENNPIGFASLDINTGKVNRSLCSTDYYIRPQYRRQGLFKKLFIQSVKLLPDEVETIQMFFRMDTEQQYPEQKVTFEKKLNDLSNVLDAKLSSIGRRSMSDLTKQNKEMVSKKARELKLKAEENGYSIVFMDNLTFEGLPFTRAQYVKFFVEIENDMPLDDSIKEDHSLSEEDYVNSFVEIDNPDFHHWIYLALDNTTQLPVAMTETFLLSSYPKRARVGNTGVQRDHRGKKLGLTLKTLMLERLLTDLLTKDKVKYWTTFNLASNKYMLAVNDQLGYVQSSIEHQYEISVKKLQEYLESH